MKTKLFILFAAIAFAFGTSKIYAQDNPEGDVTLKVQLDPLLSLKINEGQKTVLLHYKELKDYADGVKSENSKHLTVTSTGGYEIQVKAENFTYTSGNTENLNKIDLSHITLTTTGSKEDKTYAELSGETGLSNDYKQIVLSNFGGVDDEFNVTYAAQGLNEYLKNNYVKDETVTLQTTVTYTVISK